MYILFYAGMSVSFCFHLHIYPSPPLPSIYLIVCFSDDISFQKILFILCAFCYLFFFLILHLRRMSSRVKLEAVFPTILIGALSILAITRFMSSTKASLCIAILSFSQYYHLQSPNITVYDNLSYCLLLLPCR